MKQGFIKLHRKLQDCWIWKIKEPFDKRSAWIDLLLEVNHTDTKMMFNGELIEIKRGQTMTSIRKLAEKWCWSYDKTMRYLKLLESDGMIRKESDNFRTLITVENYEVYQYVPNTNRTPVSEPISEQTSEQSSEQTEHAQVTNKNDKNDKECIKNEKEITRACACETFNVEKAWKDTFEQYPKKTSAVTAKTAWMDILIDTPESNRKDVAVLIINAVRIYVDDYAKRNPDDKAFRYIPKFETWLKEDCPYWVTQFEQSQRAVAEDD